MSKINSARRMVNRTMKNWEGKVQIWAHGSRDGRGVSENEMDEEPGDKQLLGRVPRSEKGYLLLRKPRETARDRYRACQKQFPWAQFGPPLANVFASVLVAQSSVG
jgi:hypothetical protein